MKLPAKIIAGLAPLFLSACFHHAARPLAQTQPVAPVIVDNPPPPPSTAQVSLPTPVATIPAQPTKTAPTPPKTPPRPRKPKPTTPANTTTASTQEAANNPPAPAPAPAVSAIGELSSGDPADYRQETADSITSIERGLNGINRPLNDNDQKTADHIREFLKQAKAALGSGDVDGAHTLAAKARILLAELTQ